MAAGACPATRTTPGSRSPTTRRTSRRAAARTTKTGAFAAVYGADVVVVVAVVVDAGDVRRAGAGCSDGGAGRSQGQAYSRAAASRRARRICSARIRPGRIRGSRLRRDAGARGPRRPYRPCPSMMMRGRQSQGTGANCSHRAGDVTRARGDAHLRIVGGADACRPAPWVDEKRGRAQSSSVPVRCILLGQGYVSEPVKSIIRITLKKNSERNYLR